MSGTYNADPKRFPTLGSASSRWDLVVLVDVDVPSCPLCATSETPGALQIPGRPDAWEECRACGGTGREDGQPQMTVWALGWHGERGAGINPGTATPWFKTLPELEAFAEAHVAQLDAEFGGES